MKKPTLIPTGRDTALGILKRLALPAAISCIAAATSWGQISVNLGPSPVIDFSVTPPATQWATYTNGIGTEGTGTITTPQDLDTAAQTVNGATINETLRTATAPGTSRYARHNTAGGYVFTQPTGLSAAALKASLRNDSGVELNVLNVNLNFSVVAAPVTDSCPGQRAYWSFTGDPNSWTLIPELSGLTANTAVSATLSLGSWPSGGDLYILWLDDNNATGNDGGFALDNVVFSGNVLTPVAINTQPPATVTLGERGTATLTVGASGAPIGYHWSKNGAPVPGGNGPSLVIGPVVYPDDNGATYVVVVSNSLNNVTSDTVALTVNPDTVGPVLVSGVGQADLTKVTLNFSEDLFPTAGPPPGIDPANFTLFRTGTDPDDPGNQLTVIEALLQNGSNVVLTTDARTAGINYSIRVQDLLDNSSQQNPMDPSPVIQVLRASVEVIGFDTNNEWKYAPYDAGNAGDLFGTGWETVGYDDSTWPSGPAGLGLDASANGVPIRTTLAYAANSAPTFFRRHFSLPSSTNGVRLILRDVVEDGAVYYINGQVAFRHNGPADPLTYASRAPASQTDPTPIQGPFELPITNLVAGDNVIAVVVFQNGATSSDIELAVELVAEIPQFLSGPPTISTHPQANITVNEGGSATFLASAEGALPLHFQWQKGTSDVPGANGSTLTFSPAVPSDSGNYRVVVTNEFGTNTSSYGTLTVIPDTTAPSMISAVADTNLTNITIRFTERVAAVGAQNPASYAVALTAGGGALTVESAVLVNNTTVLLTTSARTQGQNYTLTVNGVTDTAAAANPVTPASIGVLSSIVLLAPDDTTQWRYFTNSLDGITWETPAYDDSAWLSALAGFTTDTLEITTNGFEIRTTNMVAPSLGGPVTAYYRVPFTLPASTAGIALHIVGVIDDGMVAYINGVEAGRLRMTNALPVSFTNLATASSPETSNAHLPLETVTLTNLAGLVSGQNLLAIELHQNATTSSDAVLSVQVVADVANFTGGVTPPRLSTSLNRTTGQLTVTWTGSGVLQHADNLLPGGAGFTDVPGNPGSGVVIPATAAKKFYRIR